MAGPRKRVAVLGEKIDDDDDDGDDDRTDINKHWRASPCGLGASSERMATRSLVQTVS